MFWPFVETELKNANLVGWLTPMLTVLACYYVQDTLIGGAFLISGVVVGALVLTWLRRPWWQQLLVLLWSVAPIGFVIFEGRVRTHLAEDRSPSAADISSRSDRR
jgi:hypothetical protein